MSGNVYPTPTLQWGALLQDPATSMQVATKEYVDAKVGGIPEAPTDGQTYGRDGQTATWNAITLTPLASSTAPLMNATTASAGSATTWSRGDHVHPTDTSRYAASNPSGYVNAAAAAAAAPVQSVATRTGAVTLTHTDITDWATSLAPYAPIASPTFTGTVTSSTGYFISTQANWPGLYMTSTATNKSWQIAIDPGGKFVVVDATTGDATWTPISIIPGNPGSTEINGPTTFDNAISGTTLRLQNAIPAGTTGQGAYFAWNQNPGDGATWILNQQGGGTGGINFGSVNATTGAVTTLASINSSGVIGAAGGTLSGNLTVSAGGISITGASTMSGGTTFTGGLNCGSTVAPAVNNFTNQIAIYGTTYGFTVTSGSMNYVASSTAAAHSWYGGLNLMMQCLGVSTVLGYPSFIPGTSTAPVQMFPGGANNNLLLGGPSGSSGVLATTATTGFPMIPTCAGTPTGTPVNGTKAAAMVYNTSSHSLNVYDPVAAGWYHLALTAGAG